ncbi:MAG: DUF4476 domain-containing protein [Daejeonella sp.]|uniref:DUF4476 domain-containing protein n=1 Tax=Daejeonella sp. TaxID=2805397 RepID=UPI003C712F92
MKTLTSTLFMCFLAIAGIAQSTSTVNIIFRGITKTTNNFEVRIDDKRYFSNTSPNNTPNYKIAINNILTGTRALKLYRLRSNNVSANANSQNTLIYSKNFILRERYDMNITVSANGSVQFSETLSEVTEQLNTGPMSTDAFNTLKQSVNSQWSQALKAEKIRDAFVNANNRFTSAQVRQLLVMVTSESDKLDLAKLAYAGVTDTENFAALSNVFSSTTRRNEFAEFVRSKAEAEASARVLISDSNFNTLVANVKSKWSQSLKGEALRDAFINSNHNYTTMQVRQLMGLVTSESDRLDLIKLAYPVVTDADNFGALYDVFASTAKRGEFNDFVISKGGAAANTGVKAQMTANNFNVLMTSIQSKWSQALKTDAVRDAFRNTNNYFSTEQIRQLMAQVTSENDRMELIKMSYPAVIDTDNFGSLVDVFSSTAYRLEFNDFVVSKGGVTVNTGVRAQMTVNNFNMLMAGIRSKSSQALRTDAVRDAFINTNNFFSTDQIRTLLTQVTSESDRLALAKQSFRSVMDPNNFYQLGDLFTSTTYKNEFNTFVNAQTGTTVILL